MIMSPDELMSATDHTWMREVGLFFRKTPPEHLALFSLMLVSASLVIPLGTRAIPGAVAGCLGVVLLSVASQWALLILAAWCLLTYSARVDEYIITSSPGVLFLLPLAIQATIACVWWRTGRTVMARSLRMPRNSFRWLVITPLSLHLIWWWFGIVFEIRSLLFAWPISFTICFQRFYPDVIPGSVFAIGAGALGASLSMILGAAVNRWLIHRAASSTMWAPMLALPVATLPAVLLTSAARVLAKSFGWPDFL